MSALDYVEIEREKGCGFANAGFRQYVKNNNTSRAIVATCRLEIREFGGTRERYEEHWVAPGAREHLGCSIGGDVSTAHDSYEWEVTGARYA